MELRSSRKTDSPTSSRAAPNAIPTASRSIDTDSVSSTSTSPSTTVASRRGKRSTQSGARQTSAQSLPLNTGAAPGVVPTAASSRTPRKRKAPTRAQGSTEQDTSPQNRKRTKVANTADQSPSKASKGKGRQKEASTSTEAMADQPSSSAQAEEPYGQSSQVDLKKKQRKSKGASPTTPKPPKSRKTPTEPPAPQPPPESDTSMKDLEERSDADPSDNEDRDEEMADAGRDSEDEENEGEEGEGDEDLDHDYDRDEDEDAFDGTHLAGLGGPGGMSGTLRALSGMMGSYSSRFRDLLAHLRQKEDPSMQLIALQSLAEILLVSTEENLSGHFSPDQFIKELVTLMSDPSPFGDDINLLACRCIANLMEALPACTANVVYGGAVPVLCEKLISFDYIELAEQALSTLEKISVEYPTSIVREGGLGACLNFLDFFATNVQRTAVTTAANCCRSIPDDCFDTVKDVMPVLLNVLRSSDQKVVEQGSLCVSRIAESFRNRPEKLEQLMSTNILRAVMSLLLPGTTNLVGPHIHTQFLRVLGITAKASPTLSVELLKMNIVDTLHQILTGVSAPTDNDVNSLRNDSVMIMQALIHRPREQVFETLNVICELLPSMPHDEMFSDLYGDIGDPAEKKDNRMELMDGCKDKLKQFAIVLLPTLIDAYSSTVNLNVRQKVLDAQLKMISNLDVDILKVALKNVQFASFLATILSQKDHTTLVFSALQCAELLLKRLPDVYRYHFHREGVIAEITKLQGEKREEKTGEEAKETEEDQKSVASQVSDDQMSDSGDSHSSSSSRNLAREPVAEINNFIAMKARSFMALHEKDETGSMKDKAIGILDDLRALAKELETTENPSGVFERMSSYFQSTTSLSSISSFELLNSGIVEALFKVLTEGADDKLAETQKAFIVQFMKQGTTAEGQSTNSPFSVLASKLQDLLSRSENFEVVTVHQNGYEGNRSSATSMLAKQLRLKLVADEDSEIPRAYRQVMVSIHAIATFKSLDDYLRPRISTSERSRIVRREQAAALLQNMASSSAAAAAAAAAAGLPPGSTTPGSGGLSQALAAFAAATGFQGHPPGTGHSSQAAGAGDNASPGTPGKKERSTRRSERLKKSASTSPSTAKDKTPAKSQSPTQKPAPECTDGQISDPEDDLDGMDAVLDDIEDEMDDDSLGDGLDAVLDDPDDDMDGESLPEEMDPVDVKMEKGGHMTARKEDGTRVATPSNAGAAPTRGPSWLSQVAQASASRPSSYAAAVQTVPQDWHIEFSVGDHVITNDMTVYKAVMLGNRNPSGETSYRNVWSQVHNIKFRKAPGPPPPDTPLSASTEASTEPTSLDNSKVSSTILHLLKVLHELNANLDDIFVTDPDNKPVYQEPLGQFVNTKLTAKLNRQLEEPLIVASACLPAWSEDLARLYPFLFPFETRHLFLQSTSYGYSRSMTRWNSQTTGDSRQDRRDDNRPYLGRLQRQKVRISRSRILESAIKVMELYGHLPSILEVEYFEEVGTGLGPTLEFYSNVSRAFAQKKLKLWREDEQYKDSEYAFGQQGLFPAPLSAQAAETESGKKILSLFTILGKFVARSMLDSRIIDISFNPAFFRACVNSHSTVKPSLGTVKTVDKGLAKSLLLLRKYVAEKEAIAKAGYSRAEQLAKTRKITVDDATVDDLCLDFTLPGYPEVDLIPNGANTSVNIFNVEDYIDKVVDFTLGNGIQKQADAFKAGFSQVFPFSALRAFTPDELVMLFGQVEEDWSLETLTDSIKADHGFNMDSKSVRNLLQVMSEFTAGERRDFLQFVTGSPKLPIGGFKSLTPMLTVVCKASEPPLTSDDFLPSVMTCVNYLKLPDYSSLEVMRERLKKAIREGQGAFHLS